MRNLLLTLLIAWSLTGQTSVTRYQAKKLTTLVAAAEKVTVQQPTNSPVQVQLETADVYCSVACVVTAYQNGSAATTTALTPTFVSGSTGSALAFSSSNVGTGTTLKSFNLPAGATISLSLTDFVLRKGASGGNNFSIGTDSISGDVRIQIQWSER
jgi:hypothetical protein